jgi:hypothetical protein
MFQRAILRALSIGLSTIRTASLGVAAIGAVAIGAAVIAVPATSAADEPVYPVKVSENGRYFVDQKGQPVFWLGTTQWQLFRE